MNLDAQITSAVQQDVFMKSRNLMVVVLVTCLLYYACFAAGQLVMRYVGGALYATPQMLPWIFPIELAMLILLVYVTRRFFNFDAVGLGRAKGRGRWLDWLLVLLPVAWGGWLLVMWLAELSPQEWAHLNKGSLLLGVLGIVMVGISEEWMFRGLVLHRFAELDGWNAALSRFSQQLMARRLAQRDWSGLGSKATGVVVNAALFSLLHAINLIGGYPPEAVEYQLIGTFAFGIFFGVLACWLPSIRPLMAWHFFWDFSMIVGNYIHVY